MKLKTAAFDNHARTIHLQYVDGRAVQIRYSRLGIKESIEEIWIDKETHGQSLGIRFQGGRKDYMPADQGLALANDHQYLLETHIERLIAIIKETLKKQGVSKRYLAEQLGTSDNQVHRLLNPAILNKNLYQLYKIFSLLGLTPKWTVRKTA